MQGGYGSDGPDSASYRDSADSRGGGARAPAGRIPPHNTEAERSVLGAVLVQNDVIHRVLERGLQARDFYRESHQKIFDCLVWLSERGEPVDLVTLTASLRDRNWFEGIGGTPTLTGLFEDTFAVGNAEYYAKIVRDKALLRRMIETCGEISGRAFDGVEDLDSFLDESEKAIFSVSDTQMTKSFSSMQEILVDNMHMIEELALKKQAVTGLPTGFHDLDKLTSGLHAGQLLIIAARPAMGKTSLVLSLAQNAACGVSKAVIALFTLEMTKEELGFKFLSGLSRIDSKRLKVGRLADRDWERLAQGADLLAKSRIFIDDSGSLNILAMRSRCRRLLSVEKKIDLIIVDYLQLMKGTGRSSNEGSREREISEISRGLKELAKDLKCPIIALSQLNRGVESRQDKRPMLSDLRESGAIEQDADLVAFVYRDEVYNKDSEDKGIAELIIAKHRAGETGTVRLAWLAEYTLFANLAPDSPGTPVPPLPRPDRGDVTL